AVGIEEHGGWSSGSDAGSCPGVEGRTRAAPWPLAAAHAGRGVLAWASAAAQGTPRSRPTPLPRATPRPPAGEDRPNLARPSARRDMWGGERVLATRRPFGVGVRRGIRSASAIGGRGP